MLLEIWAVVEVVLHSVVKIGTFACIDIDFPADWDDMSTVDRKIYIKEAAGDELYAEMLNDCERYHGSEIGELVKEVGVKGFIDWCITGPDVGTAGDYIPFEEAVAKSVSEIATL